MNYSKKFACENYSRGNNARMVTIGDITLYYSYREIIAFSDMTNKEPVRTSITVGRINEWGPTTGRHMNDVPGNAKEDRLTGRDFEQALKALIERHNLII